eukprot:gnl/Hemi2/16714_TR5602_c0_g1_i1.p1 gnl/Hemi2/16714_TR5602_c0_g1~~gnl/Hemi2/16714_TR5602_c0_g1_i1.p1  ORF type:complete len:229 (+),score=46.89 gnl/Hemi2/16714_TR5602_c0_g1_i1:154-840(+)
MSANRPPPSLSSQQSFSRKSPSAAEAGKPPLGRSPSKSLSINTTTRENSVRNSQNGPLTPKSSGSPKTPTTVTMERKASFSGRVRISVETKVEPQKVSTPKPSVTFYFCGFTSTQAAAQHTETVRQVKDRYYHVLGGHAPSKITFVHASIVDQCDRVVQVPDAWRMQDLNMSNGATLHYVCNGRHCCGYAMTGISIPKDTPPPLREDSKSMSGYASIIGHRSLSEGHS